MGIELINPITHRFRKGEKVQIKYRNSPFNGRKGFVAEHQGHGHSLVIVQFSANPYDSQNFMAEYLVRL